MLYKPHKPTRRLRSAFTLLELILALSLIVVATTLIGFLLQNYARNFESRGNDIRRLQLARSVLNMIAEDIRSVVIEQEYDAAVLEQQLGAGGEEGGGGDAGGAPAAGGLASAQPIDPGASTDPVDPGAADLDTMATTQLPLGIYGDQYSLMVDVSRVPRPDEYIVQPTGLMDGTLTDVPGDIKTVTYYVQSETNQGVADDLAVFEINSTGFSSGLVRRALDRGVIAYAEEIGNVDGISRTGDLVAPEVIALEFQYFDGIEGQWLYEWDSSQQSLPWLVQISLALQSATASETAQLQPGTSISNMTWDDRQAYGIEVFELTVAIPGANLIAADAASADAAAGMDSMGL